jgi:hypothetical protein
MVLSGSRPYLRLVFAFGNFFSAVLYQLSYLSDCLADGGQFQVDARILL